MHHWLSATMLWKQGRANKAQVKVQGKGRGGVGSGEGLGESRKINKAHSIRRFYERQGACRAAMEPQLTLPLYGAVVIRLSIGARKRGSAST